MPNHYRKKTEKMNDGLSTREWLDRRPSPVFKNIKPKDYMDKRPAPDLSKANPKNYMQKLRRGK